MIAGLRGTIHHLLTRSVLVDVHDVFYEVFVTAAALAKCQAGMTVQLYTVQYQREDGSELYGFLDMRERAFFQLLLTVSGVGPKGALGILGMNNVDELERTIAQGDVAVLTRVSGIGKKTAERIVVELKEKMGEAGIGPPGDGGGAVFEALQRLGYSAREIRTVIRIVDRRGSVGEQVRQALGHLGKR